MKLPKVGARMVKSAVAVLLCFFIDYFREGSLPFYSAIAAVLCMQPEVSHSVKVAVNRTEGTLIGGAFGMGTLWLFRQFVPAQPPFWRYFIISAMIVALIYITVLIKLPAASYITCVVFLSITVSHVADANPFWFTLNRVADTLIGIFVSLAVNRLFWPQRAAQKAEQKEE